MNLSRRWINIFFLTTKIRSQRNFLTAFDIRKHEFLRRKIICNCVIHTVTDVRDARASLGLKVDYNNCQHLGRPCGMTRNDPNKPTNVVLTPCCKYLECIGLSPNINAVPSSFPELIASALSNRAADNTIYTGACTLSLSYNMAYTDYDAYAAYVKGLAKID